MGLHCSFSTYRYPFRQPLQTHHGTWAEREGIWVTLRDLDHPDRQGVGEIAPLPWFGTETLAGAIALCQQLSSPLERDHIFAIGDNYPASQFGFESALEALESAAEDQEIDSDWQYCGLLPSGSAGLQAWEALWKQGYRTLKWKIGVDSVAEELDRCQRLLESLPEACQLRLDANGGLTLAEAKTWLTFCDRTNNRSGSQAQPRIEFLEQPLPPSDFATLLRLSQDYGTTIALDESVATVQQLQQCYDQGWSGVMVVKPAIAGAPRSLRALQNRQDLDLVFSTVFETEVGRRASLRLAQSFKLRRALGYGIQHWWAASEA